jgi:hypothetical protein
MKIAYILIDTLIRRDLDGSPTEFVFTARDVHSNWLFRMNCLHDGKEATPGQIAEYLRAFAAGIEKKAKVEAL